MLKHLLLFSTFCLLLSKVVMANVTEKEPNNNIANADTININSIKSGTVTSSGDPDDYFMAVLPIDGTLKIYIEGENKGGYNSYLGFYLYDTRGTGSNGLDLGYYVGTSSASVGSKVSDSVIFYGLAADTFYFRINTPGHFNYSIHYKLGDTSENDIEPNDNFSTAIPINAVQVKKGHIGYILSMNTIEIGSSNEKTDNKDFYKVIKNSNEFSSVIIKTTNTSKHSAKAIVNLYNSKKQNIHSQSVGENYTSYGITANDTILFSCIGADTIYIEISSEAAFIYEFTYNIKLQSSSKEVEPNETLSTATAIKLDDSITGNIGYRSAGITDSYDYFSVHLPSKGSVKIFIKATNTSDSRGYLTLLGYNKSGYNLFSEYIPESGYILSDSTYNDTLTFNCINTDTLYIAFRTSQSCFSYNFKVEYISSSPKSLFEITSTGNLYDFTNTSTNSNTYNWNFGNGITSYLQDPPLISYTPGYYETKLISSNNISNCNLRDTLVVPVIVKGIERYTPNSGGAGNILFTVFGGGFNSYTKVRLLQSGKIYVDSAGFANKYGNIYSCIIDMHYAVSGNYDVEITSGDSVYFYKDGFKLESNNDKIRTELVGASIVRSGENNSYKLRIYNDGNTIAGTTEVFILVPEQTTFKFLDSLIISDNFTNEETDTIPEFIYVTKEDGFPINGNVYGYIISGIPAGGYKDINLELNFALGQQQIYLWAKGPYDGSEWRSWGDECWKARLEFALKVTNAVVDVLGELIGDDAYKQCVLGLWKLATNSVTDRLTEGLIDKNDTEFEKKIKVLSYHKQFISTIKECAKAIGYSIPLTKPITLLIDKASMIYDIGIEKTTTVINLFESFSNLKSKCNDAPFSLSNNIIDSRTSIDPNAIIGPPGSGIARYINGNQKILSYLISFENLKTATLPAQTVIVIDTLDKMLFDLHTLKISGFGLGNKSFSIPLDTKEYITDVDIDNKIAVRLNIKLDTTTGVLKAIFQTVDKATNLITNNPLSGFLPPNVISPEGEGYISYTIEQKNSLSDGITVNNQASIIFDKNEPIVTNKWSNTLDKINPTSHVTNAAQINDTTAIITSTGFDNRSGIKFYKLYISINGRPFEYLSNINDSVTFYGDTDTTYSFYVIAVDSAGNIEENKVKAEAVIKLVSGTLPISVSPLKGYLNGKSVLLSWKTYQEKHNKGFYIERNTNMKWETIGFVAGLENSDTEHTYNFLDSNIIIGKTYRYRYKQLNENYISIYSNEVSLTFMQNAKLPSLTISPNPTINDCMITYILPESGKISIKVYDYLGRLITTLWQGIKEEGNHSLKFDSKALSNGIYIIRLETQYGSISTKALVIKSKI